MSDQKMLTELTPEQEALMPIVRDEWLAVGLSTEPTDPMKAEEAVKKAYECANLQPPKWIYHADSPLHGVVMVAVIQKWADEHNPEATKGPDPKWVREQTNLQLELARLDADIKEKARNAFSWTCYGQHDAGWLSFYDFFQRIGIPGLEIAEGQKMVARNCGWWWPMVDVCVVSSRPHALSLDDDGRLHNETMKAIEYPDNWGLYSHHGVVVPEKVIERPQELTVDEIMEEDNAEVRRVMIERFGEDRFLEKSNAKLVHQDEMGELYRVDFPDDRDPWCAVRVRNGTPESDGTFRYYAIPVPPDVTTAHEAVAWTFEETRETYKPNVEA